MTTVTAGGGHLAAAAALEEAWRALYPRDVVERIDVLEFFSPLHRRMFSQGYVKIVEHAPALWGMMFDKTDHPDIARRLSRLQRIFPTRSRARLMRHVKRFQPDAVLCTHPLPLETLGRMRKGETAAPFIVSIVTDFEAHALWMDPCVDLYCVAAPETRARLVARGTPPQNVVATGIPIASKFSAKLDGRAVRAGCGLRDDQPVLLVLGGGFGLGPVAGILKELDRVERRIQIVVVTGRNEELRRKLAAQDRKHPTRVLGFASNIHELMAAADLIVSKPGGLTSAEALAAGKPLLILDPIPGQEAANSDFLLEHGAAVKINRLEDLRYRVEQLLGSSKLADMAEAAKALARPRAAQEICHQVAARLAADD